MTNADDTRIDPMEFFEFLSSYDDYPTNGYELYKRATSGGYSKELAAFFAGMPGEFQNEADIMPLAEEVTKPPRGKRLDVSGAKDNPVEHQEKLHVEDVVGEDE